uniref:Ubiquitin/SUMO-activating enzyme ubiquitin-like domain-containing protein n=1 Tax=Octactis speculum TaxID=3111310 RepID=A0A7S2FAA2_9STRA
MRFVTAASNLRSLVFSIAPLSLYEVKGIAGNIIPAIATTNAITAGLQVMEALKILGREPGALVRDTCRYTYCLRNVTGRKGHLLQPVKLDPPVAKCFVCSKTQVHLQVNTRRMTLSGLLSKVIKGRLSFTEPTIMLGDGEIWMEGKDAEDFSVNLPKTLANCPNGGVRDGVVMIVEDFLQDLEVNILIHHQDQWPDTEEKTAEEDVEPDHFILGAPADKKVVLPASNNGTEGGDGGGGSAAEKRPLSDSSVGEDTTTSKKARH